MRSQAEPSSALRACIYALRSLGRRSGRGGVALGQYALRGLACFSLQSPAAGTTAQRLRVQPKPLLLPPPSYTAARPTKLLSQLVIL